MRRLLYGLIVCCGVSSVPLAAQNMTPALRIVTRADSLVYVYHNQHSSIEQGFNLYRKLESETDFARLNTEPIRSVRGGAALRTVLGSDLLLRIQDDLRRVDASETFLKIRTDPVAASLLVFLYPEVADALGRRALDDDAPIGQVATYRLEWVDASGQPTGETIEETVVLEPTAPSSPTDLSATNTERQVTLSWYYPRTTRQTDDKVIRFNAYRIAPGTGEPQQLNPDIILRNNSVDTLSYTFDVPRTGQTERFFVTAVDITGQMSESSAILDYAVEDLIAPETLFDVEAVTLQDGSMEVTWPVSVDYDAEGYNVYRGRSVNGDFLKMNDALLPLLQTTYADSTVLFNRSYFYRISAVDSSGNESPLSNASMALAEDRSPPDKPQDLSATFQKDGSVQLRWRDPAPPVDLKSYLVLRRQPDRNRTFTQVNREDLIATELRDEGEANRGFSEGAFYEYVVLAADSSRNFSDSSRVIIQIPDLTAPEAPSDLQITNDGGYRLNVTWQATPSTDAIIYRLYRQDEAKEDSLLARLPLSMRFYRDDTVIPGRIYTYAISAVDSLGNESERTVHAPFRMRDFAPPLSVRNVRARFIGNGVEVQWEKGAATDLAGYRVLRASIPTGVYEPLTDAPLTGNVLSKTVLSKTVLPKTVLSEAVFFDATGTAGNWYRVVAVDKSGNESKPSSPAQALVDSGADGQ